MKTLKQLTLLLALIPAAVYAQTVRTWVSTTGSDLNPCTRTSPCRNFNAAIDAVDPFGEVVVLESGGYGPFLVDKSVAVIAPSGIHAAVAPTVGTAVNIFAGVTDVVTLRGLYLNEGPGDGINVGSAGRVHIESCVVNGFGGTGVISFAGNPLKLTLIDTVLRNNSTGVRLQSASSLINALIDRCRIENSTADGLRAGDRSRVVVRDSVFSANAENGVRTRTETVGQTAEVTVVNSAITGAGPPNSIGVLAETSNGTGSVIVWRTTVSNCQTGISVGGGEIVVLADSTITGNVLGLFNLSGTLESRQNNTVSGNQTESFATITPFPGI